LQNGSNNDGTDSEFTERMEAVYTTRGYDSDPRYSEFAPTYLQRVQSMETAHLAALGRLGLHARLDQARALDFGCGNGHWMARMISWGFPQESLSGVDVREGGVRAARRLLPGCRIEQNVDGVIPFAAGCFDVCFVNLVFTSILDDARRIQAANELQRVTRPGGVILVLDFRFNNPSNPNVRMLTLTQLRALFDGCSLLERRSLVLAPPIASRVVPRARWLGGALESLPFLRTHFLAVLGKST
jgi:SAM-dependent methyltransferase